MLPPNWIKFRDRTPEQNKLIEDHYSLVARTVRSIKVPRFVTRDDLQADGAIGLIKASVCFNPERHVSFETYARHRIWGEVMDGIRRRMFTPRGFVHCLSVIPESQLPLQAVDGMLTATEKKPDSRDYAQEVENRLDAELVLSKLPAKHATMLRMVFLEGQLMKDVAKHFHVSESRVSQIVKKLRAAAAKSE